MKQGEEAKVYGALVEDRFMKMFKGKKSSLDEVDFETSRCLYEVKSCKLFNTCYNGNHLLPFVNKQNKRCKTKQQGRFQIITNNHIMLYLKALQTGKIPKYVFAVRYGKQVIFKVLNWEEVKIPNSKDYHYIVLKDIFGEL